MSQLPPRKTAENQAGPGGILGSIPGPVVITAWLATLVGALFCARFCIAASQGVFSYPRAIAYGLLIFALLFFNGFALARHNRASYILLTIVPLLPAPGLLTQCLHALSVLLVGRQGIPGSTIAQGITSMAQLATTGVLLAFLMSRVVRQYAWNKACGQHSGDGKPSP
jgi:hypothetical protein